MAERMPQSAFPDYWDKALNFLSDRDPVMKARIARYRHVPFRAHPSVLDSILRAIVGQQVSNTAAATVWTRLTEQKQGRWESFILIYSTQSLIDLGLNTRKVAAMKEVAWRWVTGRWSEEKFRAMSDEEAITEIVSVKGLGPWSAMSVLIFALQRPDVFPETDFGIRVALIKNYLPHENIKTIIRSEAQSRVKLIADVWAPYRTVATWFLWRSLENTPFDKESE